MAKAAAVVLADIETHEDLGRVVNTLETVKEFKDAGDEAALIFDGARTRRVGELARPDHRSHRLYEEVKDRIARACAYCAGAFRAREAIEAEGIPLREEHDRHPSLRKYIVGGYQFITF
jgi:hypothetical protein